MSTKDYLEKDYYKALGVAKTAKPAEIKAAYRKLARKYHPDANKGDSSAEERFKEISEAYSVLSDEKRRKEYDEARSMFGGGFRVPTGTRPGGQGGFGGFDLGDIFGGSGDNSGLGDILGGVFNRGRTTAQNRPRRGTDVETETTLTFGDAIDGTTVSLRLTGEGPCPTCHGTGAKAGTVPRMCPSCQGTGQSSRNLGSFGISEPCKECRGRGLVVDDPCPACTGSGRAMSSRTIQARIPAGVTDGARIKLASKGAPGERGGPSGDLYVRVHVKPHPVFGRQGSDLTVDHSGDVRRGEPRRGGQGARAPWRPGHRADPGGHPERADVPRPRQGGAPQGRHHGQHAGDCRGDGAAEPEQQGAQCHRGPARGHRRRRPA